MESNKLSLMKTNKNPKKNDKLSKRNIPKINSKTPTIRELKKFLFPLIKKETCCFPVPQTKSDIYIRCPIESCKCSFFIPKSKNPICICPKGHNICIEVI